MAKVENTEGNMINTDLTSQLEEGATRERADQFTGRVIQLGMEDAHKLKQGFIENNVQQYTAFHTGAMDKPPRWMGASFGAAKRSIPDFSRAKGKTIAGAYAHDWNQLNAAREADKDGKYVKVDHPDGHVEQGIVDEVDGKVTREGQWVSRDKAGNVRQIANFTGGNPDGPAFAYDTEGRLRESAFYKEGKPAMKHNSYNADGERVHEAVYEDGELTGERSIDPKEEAAKREARKAERQARHAIGMRH